MSKFLFKAKREIEPCKVDVETNKVTITGPQYRVVNAGKDEEPTKVSPATIDLQIRDVEHIELTDQEWAEFKKMITKIAKRAPNLKEIQANI